MDSDNNLLSNVIAVSAIFISSFVFIFSVIFTIIGSITGIPLDATIFWIFLILLLISFVLIGFTIIQRKTSSYGKEWVIVLLIAFGTYSLISLIFSYLGLYDLLDAIFTLFTFFQ